MIVVTGATGTVGRQVVAGLLDQVRPVRALVRDPAAAALPSEVEVVAGDLSDPQSLAGHVDGASEVFLVWPFFSADGAGDVVEMLAQHVERIVYLSAEAATRRPDAFWSRVEAAVEATGAEWTFLRPTGFAANTRTWADQIRRSDVVRWVYGQAARSLIDERDIATVALHALTEDGHAGARYVLTGPAAVTQVEQVTAIGDALGRPLRWEEIQPAELKDGLADVPDTALDTWAGFVRDPEVVTSTVEEITGRPARPFAEWAREHVDDFR